MDVEELTTSYFRLCTCLNRVEGLPKCMIQWSQEICGKRFFSHDFDVAVDHSEDAVVLVEYFVLVCQLRFSRSGINSPHRLGGRESRCVFSALLLYGKWVVASCSHYSSEILIQFKR